MREKVGGHLGSREKHHTLSAIKSSHALRLVQKHFEFLIHPRSAIFPSRPAMTPTVMLSDFRVTPLSETDRSDTAINNERKSTFSFLYLRNCRVRPDIAANRAEQLLKLKTNAEICWE